jgi:hypothetical protein
MNEFHTDGADTTYSVVQINGGAHYPNSSRGEAKCPVLCGHNVPNPAHLLQHGQHSSTGLNTC